MVCSQSVGSTRIALKMGVCVLTTSAPGCDAPFRSAIAWITEMRDEPDQCSQRSKHFREMSTRWLSRGESRLTIGD